MPKQPDLRIVESLSEREGNQPPLLAGNHNGTCAASRSESEFSPETSPIYEEIARLLDHASTTLDMATGILGEMAKGFSEEAETLRKLRG